MLDRRPPHYRCPAVPGLRLQTSARAILMALRSSVLPSLIDWLLLTDFTAGYCELNLSVMPLRYCSRSPLITAGHPVRSSVPSPTFNRSGFETPPPHRPARCNCTATADPAAQQFVSARSSFSLATRENIPTPPFNVYCGRNSFSPGDVEDIGLGHSVAAPLAVRGPTTERPAARCRSRRLHPSGRAGVLQRGARTACACLLRAPAPAGAEWFGAPPATLTG